MPDLIYNVKFNIDSSETEKIVVPIDGSSMAEVEQLKEEINELRERNDELVNSLTTLEETMARLGRGSGGAAGRVGRVGDESRKTGKRVGDLNKQTAAFNQTIFAFGDLAQDTIQFQYGIATGMRAIGNNIGFAAELFANAALNVRRYNEAVESGAMGTAEKTTVLKAFISNLFGVGGLILAVNASTTVITLLTSAMEKSKKEMEASVDVLNQYAGAMARLSMFNFEDILGTEQLRLQIKELNSLFSEEFETPKIVDIEKVLSDLEFTTAIRNTYKQTGQEAGELFITDFIGILDKSITLFSLKFAEISTQLFTDSGYMDSVRQIIQLNQDLGRSVDMLDLAQRFVDASSFSPADKAGLTEQINEMRKFADDQDKVMDFMVKSIKNYSEFGDMFVNDFRQNVDVMQESIEQYRQLQELGISGEELVESIKEMNKELAIQDFLLNATDFGRYIRDTSLAAETLVQFNQAGAKNEEQIRDMIKALKLERTAQLSLAQSTVASNEAKEEAIGFIRFLNKLIPQLEGALDDTTESTKDFSDELFDVSTRIRRAVFEASQFEAISMFGDASGEAAELIFNQSEALVALTKEIKDAQEESPKLAERLQRLMDVVGVKQQQDLLSFGASLSGVFDAPQSEVEELTAQYEDNVSALVMLINTQEKGSPVRAALIQQLLDLQSGYKGAKQAIEDKTRAEYADLIASEQALNQYGKAYQQAVMFVREHEAALAGLSPELQALEGQYASLAAQNLVQSLIGQFDTGEDPMDKLNRQLADTRAALNLLADSPLIDQDQLNAALLALEGVGLQQKELIENQEVLNNLQAAMSMAQAIGQLGEVFEASKQFQYAVALTSGALGIVLALSDSTQKSTLARFALAASVAAATAVQIKQIADTNIGSTGNVQEPSAGSYFGSGSGFTSVAPPTQQISFAPTNSTSGGDTVVNNQVLVDSRGLAIQTKIGERQVKNSQKTVQPEP
jgi:cell division protein FtsB